MDSPAPDDSDQPAKKRQRLSEPRVEDDKDTVEPMELANGNAGSPHRQDDDRVGPRKLIPRCSPGRATPCLKPALAHDGFAATSSCRPPTTMTWSMIIESCSPPFAWGLACAVHTCTFPTLLCLWATTSACR